MGPRRRGWPGRGSPPAPGRASYHTHDSASTPRFQVCRSRRFAARRSLVRQPGTFAGSQQEQHGACQPLLLRSFVLINMDIAYALSVGLSTVDSATPRDGDAGDAGAARLSHDHATVTLDDLADCQNLLRGCHAVRLMLYCCGVNKKFDACSPYLGYPLSNVTDETP